MNGWRPSVRACVRSGFSMLLTTQFSGQGARCGKDFDMSGRNNSTNKAIIIVKAHCSRLRIVQIFVFVFILYTSSLTVYGTV